MNRELKIEHSVVYEMAQAINMERGTPASAADVVEALPDGEKRLLAEAYDTPLRQAIQGVLATLERRGLLSSVKAGRVRMYYSPDLVTAEAVAAVQRPPRRRRVLSLVYRAVELLRRAVRASEVVEVAEQEGLTDDIPPAMIKRDLTNLAKTGELSIVGTVRGDGGGTNLYLPADLDPATYAIDTPLTWLEQLRGVFGSVWAGREATAAEEGRKPVPPSTGDIRDHLSEQYPDHPQLDDPQLLVNGMAQLASTTNPQVRRIRRKGERALLWAPVGVADDELDLGAAHAGDSERVADAVRRALNALNVPAINVRDVKDQVEIEPCLQPAGRLEIYEILSDLAREELHNGDGTRSPRAYQRVIRAGLVQGTAYYTVPGIDGVAEYLELLRLRAEWPALEADVRLRSLNACPLPTVLKGRALLLAAECADMADRATATGSSLGHDEWAREVQMIGEEATACANAARALAETLDVPGLPATPARLSDGFTPEQLSRQISPRYPLAADGMTTARLVPLLEHGIRRIPNPRYERRFATDGEVAAEFLFDRVEALAYAAFRWGDEDERYYGNLAATTLGRLRDARFVSPALLSDRFEERQIAIACLALLGDPSEELTAVAEGDPDTVVRAAAKWALGYVSSTMEDARCPTATGS
jgi:hypothetical protein